jgi:hypothetical protein
VFDSEDVGNDSQGESTDNCATAATPDCTKIKNAIQADVVATGPPDSRYITKAYVGDLDGNVWRFDFAMVSGSPSITAKTNLYAAGPGPPAIRIDGDRERGIHAAVHLLRHRKRPAAVGGHPLDAFVQVDERPRHGIVGDRQIHERSCRAST